eukprot:c6823_g1_i2.p1 GENE.c6823_g1_i2~~c6823_g1_i2.p1  ORF type:complete len:282 (+),score=54.92 c6823_g1_i2:43-846(+)
MDLARVNPPPDKEPAQTTQAPARGHLSLSPVFQETYLRYEFRKVCEKPVPGVYVLPGEHNIRMWYGVVFVTKGPWMGGIYHFRLIIPDLYPNEPPKVVFDNLFHPRLPRSKPLRVDAMFLKLRPWNQHKHSLRHIFICLPTLFSEKSLEPLKQTTDEKGMEDIKKQIELSVSKSVGMLPAVCVGSSIKFSTETSDHKQVENVWTSLRSKPQALTLDGLALIEQFRVPFAPPDYITNQGTKRIFRVSPPSSPVLASNNSTSKKSVVHP